MSVSASANVASKTPSSKVKAKRAVRVRARRKSPLIGGPRANKKAKKTTAERQYLEPPELKRFFEAMPKTAFWYSYFFIQYVYGCRISEPALLRDTDVSFKKRQITIRRLHKLQEKGGYHECVCKADQAVLDCVRIAQRWKAQKKIPSASSTVDGNPFVFAADRRRPATSLGVSRLSKLRTDNGWQAVSRMSAHRVFKQIAAEIKLPSSLQHSHVLRETRVVMLLASGMAPVDVQTYLGHPSIKMTESYIPLAAAVRAKFGLDAVNAAVSPL
jgi:integrase